MARRIAEIKKEMTDAFMADETLKEAYGIPPDKMRFEDCFSAVSLESLLFYIVASCHFILESIFEKFSSDIDYRISRAVVASIAWYYEQAKAFQYGDSLVFNPKTYGYNYEHIDKQKQKIKYVAVRDRGSSIEMLVSGEMDKQPSVLSDDVLTAFKRYINAIKIAGVVVNIYSRPADDLMINAQIKIDPLRIDTKGVEIASGIKPIEEAIKKYLSNIIYGGTFNKTDLVDAIQRVQGVVDVSLKDCAYRIGTSSEWKTINENNYTSRGGSFTLVGIENTLSYVV